MKWKRAERIGGRSRDFRWTKINGRWYVVASGYIKECDSKAEAKEYAAMMMQEARRRADGLTMWYDGEQVKGGS